MNHKSDRILPKELVDEIMDAAIEVLKEIGQELHQKPYENALVIELGLRGVKASPQTRFPVLYKGHHVADYVPDLIAGNAIVIDARVIDRLTDHQRGQMPHHLRTTKLRVGFIL